MLNRRLRGMLVFITAMGSWIGPGSPALAKPVTLAPFVPWNVDYGLKICTLRRAFGTREKPSLLIMNRFGPGDRFQLTVVSDEFKSFEQGQTLTLRFGEQKPRRIASVIPGQGGKKTATLFFSNVSLAETIDDDDDDDDWRPSVTPATEAAVKSITISTHGRDRIFATGPLDKPLAALRKCTDSLVKTWGLDPEQQARLSKHPEPLSKPGTWLRSDDYPSEMLFSGKQAQVNFRLSVDDQGKPTACEVQSSYNDKKFDEVTCTMLMRRARFSPALDAKGGAVPSYYINTVRWIMQG